METSRHLIYLCCNSQCNDNDIESDIERFCINICVEYAVVGRLALKLAAPVSVLRV
jgi:hypothetical protein